MKVAMIPDETRIVINAGKNNKLTPGTYIQVYEAGPNIIDPDTNEIIEEYPIVKDKLQITEVYDDYSIARKTISDAKEDILSKLVTSPMQKKRPDKYISLNVNSEDNLSLTLSDHNINVGDLVRVV